MSFKITFNLLENKLSEEYSNALDVLEKFKSISWEQELEISSKEVHFPSIDIIHITNQKLLTITALESIPNIMFTVENINVGKLARGTTGTLINHTPYEKVLNILNLFTQSKYSEIEALDNTGFLSKALRKITFLFASED